jgi:hypothetical protein
MCCIPIIVIVILIVIITCIELSVIPTRYCAKVL